jgi:NADPH-dependent 2,4-dienoyl-CoA reductase/sulfur reductase-like enzyme/rhodanese-related sulfurtransferase
MSNRSDFCIVGGTAAGPKTAATLARRLPKATITIFEKGNYLSYAACGLPYFASGDIDNFAELTKTSYGVARTVDFFLHTKGFNIVTDAEVISIDRQKKSITVKMTTTGETFDHSYGKLVLATGAMPKRPVFPVPVSPNIRSFTRPDDAIDFRRKAEKGEIGKAVIIGGGLIGCEMAESFGGMWGIKTILLEKESQLLPNCLDPEMAAIVENELVQNKVEVRTGTLIEKIELGRDNHPVIVIAGGEKIETDYALLCLGVEPETTLARACDLKIGKTGGIFVDDYLRTSDPDIYAGGDCVESHHLISGEAILFPMGSLANRHGRVIAENLAENSTIFPGVLGSFLVKAFDLNVGGVGLTEAAALRAGFAGRAVWGSFTDKPDYYPESKAFTLKIIYSRTDRRLLGIQAIGTGDICRRIDVFSSFLQRQAVVDDLFGFEHGYAPPYAEALDPLHHMAAVAQAQERGIDFISPGFHFDRNVLWLDVREPEEAAAELFDIAGMGIEGKMLNIPLNMLTSRLGELDCTAKTIVICRRGPRAYQAAIMLQEAGFTDIHVLAAGIYAATPGLSRLKGKLTDGR